MPRFAHFTNAQANHMAVAVNIDKVLALYDNSHIVNVTSGPGTPAVPKRVYRTFIELGPDGHSDSTGPIVDGTIEHVIATLQAAALRSPC